MMNVTEFGALIAKKRKEANLTQEAFAAKLGITAQAVSKWENGIGLPDVTLFPAIASTLGVSIDALFGVNTSTTNKYIEFPNEHRGMPFICSRDHRACYSSKEINRIDKDAGVVYFADGSTADLVSATVRNCGIGEITIYQLEKRLSKFTADAPTELDVELGSFCSIYLELNGCCSGVIEKSTDGVAHLRAEGSAYFINALKYDIHGSTLEVTRKNASDNNGENNRIVISVPFEHGKELTVAISGCGDCLIDPTFDTATFRISGSGDITGSSAGSLTTSISGSGAVTYAEAKEHANFTISGSGCISMKRASDVKAAIAGSGSVSIDDISTALDVTISGSGDISASGEIETLKAQIKGSGNISAQKLSVRNADLNADGCADIHIGHIKGTSIECISQHSTLVVDRRGE